MKRNKNLRQGFTLVEIMIVVAIIGLLAAIAIPNFVRARESAQTNACINNLRQIDGAKQQWALETRQAPGAACAFADISAYLGRSTTAAGSISCPSGGSTANFTGSYTVGTLGTVPLCSIAGSSGHVLD